MPAGVGGKGEGRDKEGGGRDCKIEDGIERLVREELQNEAKEEGSRGFGGLEIEGK